MCEHKAEINVLCLNLTFSGSQALRRVISNLKLELRQPLYILVLIKDISGRAVARRHSSNIYDSVSFAEEIWVLQEAYSAFCNCKLWQMSSAIQVFFFFPSFYKIE